MAAASTTDRALPGEKAARIVEAMRASVAQRGVAGSTFDHVAGEAGVSRGLLHYYFGSKERLVGAPPALAQQRLAAAAEPPRGAGRRGAHLGRHLWASLAHPSGTQAGPYKKLPAPETRHELVFRPLL